jgi:hypothetical protein
MGSDPVQDGGDVADDLVLTGVHLVGVRGGVEVQHRGGQPPWADQLDRVEAGRQDEVGVGQEVPDHAVAGHVEHAGEVGVVLGEQAFRHRTGDYRDARQRAARSDASGSPWP